MVFGIHKVTVICQKHSTFIYIFADYVSKYIICILYKSFNPKSFDKAINIFTAFMHHILNKKTKTIIDSIKIFILSLSLKIHNKKSKRYLNKCSRMFIRILRPICCNKSLQNLSLQIDWY